MRAIAKPVRTIGNAWELLALRIDAVARPRQRHSKLRIVARDPLLLQISFGELGHGDTGYAEALLQQGMTHIPTVCLHYARRWGRDLPRIGRTPCRLLFLRAAIDHG